MRIQHLLYMIDPRALAGPIGQAPGEVPNDAPRLLWAIWAVTVASAVFLALRIYCKVSRRRSLWWDDHFLVASWVSTPCPQRCRLTRYRWLFVSVFYLMFYQVRC